MYEQLKKYGVPVKMTRTIDETLSPTERVNRILSAYGNSPNVIVISNHINAGGGDGAEVIYALRNKNTLSNLILNNIEEVGQNVRDAYQRRLPSNTAQDYYFIHRNTGNTEPIIIEYGFLDSKGDDPTQLKNDYKKIVDATVSAILEYIGIENEQSGYYIVKQGDTLWSIAKNNNISVNELKNANNLTSNSLSVGQKLFIPNQNISSDIPPTAGNNTYIVKSKDTLYSIALQNGITVDELKSLNKLSSNELKVGQILKLPSANNIQNEYYTTYIVKLGDSLYSIARNYNVSVQDIINYNNLSSNLLSIGQNIKIPKSNSYITYTVKSGDNLYVIAKKYNKSVQKLMDYNNLKTNLLSIGQVIKIPN